MNDNAIDTIGEVFWFLTFATLVITIPVVWKYSKQNKLNKLLICLLWAFLLSLTFFIVSWIILFRDGMGPT